MTAADVRWLAGVVITVVLALIGLVWSLVRARQDKADERQERADTRLNVYHTDNVTILERVVRLETEMHITRVEVDKIREMRHEIMTHTTATLAEWYVKIVEMIKNVRRL